VLEVGFGNGNFLAWCLAHQIEYVGIDKEVELANRAKAMGVLAFTDINCIPHEFRFDMVFMFDVLEHLSEDQVIEVLGYVSDRLGKRKPFLFIAGFLGTLLISLLIYYPRFSTLGVYTLLFILGILTSIQNLTYCVAIESNPPKYKGAITGYVNLFVFLLGAISQPLVGFLMERHSTVIFKSTGVYTLKDFQYSFGFFPLCFALAFVFVFFINDKKKV
jgi:hypothetical protein